MFKLLLSLLFITSCFAKESNDLVVWNKYKDGLYKAFKAYVAEFSNEKTWKKWNDTVTEQMETRTLPTIALDWFSDNRQNLEEKIPSAITKACFFFIKFVDTNTLPPFSVRSNITEQNMQDLQNYLEQCVEEVKVQKDAKP